MGAVTKNGKTYKQICFGEMHHLWLVDSRPSEPKDHVEPTRNCARDVFKCADTAKCSSFFKTTYMHSASPHWQISYRGVGKGMFVRVLKFCIDLDQVPAFYWLLLGFSWPCQKL